MSTRRYDEAGDEIEGWDNGPGENGPQPTDRPPVVTDEHLAYLDALREAGVTNMFGAGPYFVMEFGVGRTESRAILGYWMETFSERHHGEAGR